MGESHQAREVALPKFRDRLQAHEEASRKQAFNEGRERPKVTSDQLDRTTTETARRHDRRSES